MKLLYKKSIGLVAVILLINSFGAFAQNAQKGSLSIAINYFIDNNKIPYLLVKVKTKIDGRFKPVGDIPLQLFLGKDSAGTLIGKVTTDDKGEASTIIPTSLKAEWGTLISHTFLATFEGNKNFDPAKADLSVSKAKILIDTTTGRKIIVSILALKDSGWVPVKGVELIVAVKRMDADLNVNETATFTTDSTGKASADFKRDSIPGDAKGNITLVAKVEDNDQFGNLSIEQPVPWGRRFVPVNTFGKRTLFATRGKAPIWLILMATSIMVTVWGILISLVVSLFKIRKLGREV